MIQYLRRLGRGGGDIFGELLRQKVSDTKRIIVDFSSPNIAKQFHIGNLRSTLIGDFYCRMNRLAGHEVISINYLGDWGTQIALLAAHWPGSEAKKQFDALKPEARLSDKLIPMMNCYVEAWNMAEKDPELKRERALQLLDKMEMALIEKRMNDPSLETWTMIRKLSIDYLTEFYKRFGIQFDVWDAESYYVADARRIAEGMIQSGITSTTSEGLKIIHDKEHGGYIVVGKSTNKSSLYITRDLAAVIDRQERFNADSYVYVVDYSQSSHFEHLRALLSIYGRDDIVPKLHHLRFGRLLGFSTRKGIMETVEQVLEDGAEEAEKYIRKSKTMKVTEEEIPEAKRELAEAALVNNDLKRHRTTNYAFYADKAFRDSEKSFYLQEKYARLCSLIDKNAEVAEELTRRLQTDMSELNLETDVSARALFQCLYELDGSIYSSYSLSESCPLVNYLSRLCSRVGSAVSELRVKEAPNQQVALNRLLLFVAARNVMKEGFDLVGIKPLTRI